MSRIRKVKGNITKTCNGVTIIDVRSGDFIAAAGKENNWNGKGGGMSHLAYDPSHPANTLKNSLNLKLNLFFDGTANNLYNTEARENNTTAYEKKSNKKDDSYENDYTNVARGFAAVSSKDPKQIKVYVGGVGTTDLKTDDTLPKGIAQSVGFWNTGIADKVKLGCELAAIAIEKAADGKPIDQLTINVYGFSRGAATARHFLDITNVVFTVGVSKEGYYILPGNLIPIQYPENKTDKSKPPYPESFEIKTGYFGTCLASHGVVEVGTIVFNFVGLYDTVSSHGFSHNNDVKDLGLDAVKKARMIFQLSAADEYRENFDLTNIYSCGRKGLELTLPGVHSDIGGSYRQGDKERSVVLKERFFFGTRDKNFKFIPNTPDCDAFKKILLSEGWYNDDQLTIEYDYDKSEAYLVGTRVLENTYDKVALNKMIMLSKQFGVKYDETIEEQKTIISDPFIASVFDQLTKYSQAVMEHRNEAIIQLKPVSQYLKESEQISYLNYINPKDLKELRRRYLHWSVKADEFGLEPRFSKVLPIEKRKREIHNG